MTELTASVVQQEIKIYDTLLEYQEDIFKFLQMAQAKKAQLVVLPALSPLMLIPPLASGTKLGLLKTRRESKGGVSGLVGRLLNKATATVSQAMGGIKGELLELLENYPAEIYDAYIDLFSAAALKYQMTIVAGSFYLREYEGDECTHTTYIFGPDGMILGRQAKIHLNPEERGFCRSGEVLRTIDTPVGRIGILINEDVLYPECGRILAYQGVEVLVNLTACVGLPTYEQTRSAFLARVDENEVLGLQSALVGRNLLDPGEPELVGRSALLQPFQLSKNGDGIISEVGETTSESSIAETISLESLKNYWIRPTPRLRQSMQMPIFIPLASVYNHQKTLDQAYWNPSDDLFQEITAFEMAFGEPVEVSTSETPTEEPSEDLLFSPFADDDDDDNNE